MIQSMAHVLDMLEEIKKYLYVQQQDAKQTLDAVRTPSKIGFQTCSRNHSAGVICGQQSLMFAKFQGHWVVDQVRRSCYSECLLTQCEPNDLKSGDVAYMSSKNIPDFENLSDYYIILDADKVICWDESGEINVLDKNSFVSIFKVKVP